MAITYTEYGTGSVWNAISSNPALWSSLNITSFSATGADVSFTSGGNTYRIVAIGNFNIGAVSETPATMADIVSNAALVNSSTMSSVQEYKNGILYNTRTYSPASSFYNDLYLDTSLAIDNVVYAGHDVFYSSSGNSVTTNHDTIFGYTGYVTYYDYHGLLTNGADNVHGGTGGVNTVVLQGATSHYTLSTSNALWDAQTQANDLSGYYVTDTTGATNTVAISNIQRLQFSDTMLALDNGPTQTAGAVYMLYQATFNRTPDVAGLGYWINAVDKGANIITNVASFFVTSSEFVAKYGSNPTNASYVDNLYQNVLHRAGDAGGITYWNTQLNSGAVTKAYVLEQFATLAEGAANVAPTIAHGIAYTQWVG